MDVTFTSPYDAEKTNSDFTYANVAPVTEGSFVISFWAPV